MPTAAASGHAIFGIGGHVGDVDEAAAREADAPVTVPRPV